MSGISTHVLDTSQGKPASEVRIRLEVCVDEEWAPYASGITDSDGRCAQLVPAANVEAGKYRIVFETGAYFDGLGIATLYPEIVVILQIASDRSSYHIPLLLSPFGYSTYRGS